MTRDEFEDIVEADGWDWAVADLSETHDSIWNRDSLKDLIKTYIDNENWSMASHLIEYMREDDEDTEWWDYDECMGLQDFPAPIAVGDISAIEHLFEEEKYKA